MFIKSWLMAVSASGDIGLRRIGALAVLASAGIGLRRYWLLAIFASGGFGFRRYQPPRAREVAAGQRRCRGPERLPRAKTGPSPGQARPLLFHTFHTPFEQLVHLATWCSQNAPWWLFFNPKMMILAARPPSSPALPSLPQRLPSILSPFPSPSLAFPILFSEMTIQSTSVNISQHTVNIQSTYSQHTINMTVFCIVSLSYS